MELISDFLHRKASYNKVPLSGTFEISPVCNFACKMCYVRKTNAQICAEGKRLRSADEWLALAEKCKEAGTLYLLITGGEPFLYPGFKELYIKLHEMGFIISINTNGTLIDDETLEWLKKYAPSRLNITLYGASRETYGRICENPAGYDRAVNAIKKLKEAGIPVVINASMIPENADDLEDILDFGKSLSLNTRMSTYMFPPARRERESGDSRFTPEESAKVFLRKQKKLCSEEEYTNLLEKLSKASAPVDPSDDWGNDAENEDEFMKCRAGRSSFWVSWEGKMTACGMLDFPRAEYPFEDDFKACWLRLTDAVRSTAVLKGCASCDKREVCKPCVAMIHTETGTVDEKAPYLCRMAECIHELIMKELEEKCHEQRQTR